MLFEMIVQTFLGVIAIYFSLKLLRSRRAWKLMLGILLMGAGVAFTLTTGEFLMWLLGYVPAVGLVKSVLIVAFPFLVAGSFLAWLAYVFFAFVSRLGTISVLLGAFKAKYSKADHVAVAKNNALKDQMFWLVACLVVTIIGLIISIQSWFSMDTFSSNSGIMIIALVWAYAVPPLVIHSWLKKPEEIMALKQLAGLQGIKDEKISDYRELIAVMDEIKDEELKAHLDEIIVEGLTKALIQQKLSDEDDKGRGIIFPWKKQA